MPLKEEVCRACQQGNGGFNSADVDRWENHNLILCPAVYMQADPRAEDKRTLRDTSEEPPSWCPSKEKHNKPERRRYYGSSE